MLMYPQWLAAEYERRQRAKAARRFGIVCLALLAAVAVWVGLLP